MRKRSSFLITIFSAEDNQLHYSGRLKNITSGHSTTFSNMQELQLLISAEMAREEEAPLPSPLNATSVLRKVTPA